MAVYTAEYTFPDDLSYQVYVKARQVKRNGVARTFASCTNPSADFWIDITVPILQVTPVDIGTQYCSTSTATVAATATDIHSGIASVKSYIDGVTSATLTNGIENLISLGADSTNKVLKITATDNMGNSSSWERSFILDTTAPTGLESADITSKFGKSIIWMVDLSSATDATSGLGGYEVRAADSGWGDSSYIYKGAEGLFTQTTAVSSNTTLYFALWDKAGNYSVAVSSTAVHYPPALVSSASITYSPEINAVTCSWDAVSTDSQGSTTDVINGYVYFIAYRDAAGVFQYNSATQYTTTANSVYIPIPIDKILTNGDNAIKVYVKATDNWGASSSDWAISDIMTTRRISSVDIGNNAFLYIIKRVQETGSATVSYSPTGTEDVSISLGNLLDGDFNNEV